MEMIIIAIYEESVIIKRSFSKLIEELGEIEAKEDIDGVLGRMRNRNYYGLECFGYFYYYKEHF